MHIEDLLKLSGIIIIVIGFALKLRTTLVVVVAALVTGLLAGLPLFSNDGIFKDLPLLTRPGRAGIINILGREFANRRLITLFIITLPAIGLAEKYGLQEQAAVLIRRVHAATVGRLQIVYQLFRVLHGLMGIRFNGHPAFVRPLVFPMSLGAVKAESNPHEVPSQKSEKIKAANAAAENYGNFYGQNLSPVQAGILLVGSVMQGLGYVVGGWSLVLYTIPIVVASILLGIMQFSLFDHSLGKDTEVRQ